MTELVIRQWFPLKTILNLVPTLKVVRNATPANAWIAIAADDMTVCDAIAIYGFLETYFIAMFVF